MLLGQACHALDPRPTGGTLGLVMQQVTIPETVPLIVKYSAPDIVPLILNSHDAAGKQALSPNTVPLIPQAHSQATGPFS